MAGNDGYLRGVPSDTDSDDGRLYDPTTASGKVDYVLTCAVGTYVITGQAATLTLARKLSLAAGAYVYTGQAATLVVARNLSLAVGAYSYAGLPAILKLDRKLALAAGAYAYAGNDATLTYASGMSPRAHPEPTHGSKHPWIHGKHYALPDIGEIEPEIAQAVVKVVDAVIVQRSIQNAEIDTAKAEREFRLMLEGMQKQWADQYAQLIWLEYERREQEMEDAAIAMLLFDM